MNVRGVIIVTDNGIEVVKNDDNNGSTQASYSGTSTEELRDAARVLAGWLNLLPNDPAERCRTIHNREQRDAAIRQFVDDAMRDLEE